MSTYIYEDGATHHDHHKEMTIHISGKTDMVALIKAFMNEDAEDVSPEEILNGSPLPEPLCTQQAEALHAKLCAAGIVDAAWQPVGLSNAEKGTLVEYIVEKLGIHSKWKFFGNLWKIDPETLRTAKARGLDQNKTWKFRSKLDSL